LREHISRTFRRVVLEGTSNCRQKSASLRYRQCHEIFDLWFFSPMVHDAGTWSSAMSHSAGLWPVAIPHSAGLFLQNLFEDEYVWSRPMQQRESWSSAMLHSVGPLYSAMSNSAGQNCIALYKLVKHWTPCCMT
jgi:hypothetical protein